MSTLVTIYQLILSATVFITYVTSCCHFGTVQTRPGKSCHHILLRAPGCKNLNGYYWIEPSPGGTPQQVYCLMDTDYKGGGWERLLYMTHNIHTCPFSGLSAQLFYNTDVIPGWTMCTINDGGAGQVVTGEFNPISQYYSEFMVQLTVVHNKGGNGFVANGVKGNLNNNFDGIRFSYNDSSGFLKHIYSLVISDISSGTPGEEVCMFYSHNSESLPPFVVGNDHTCARMSSPLSVWNSGHPRWPHLMQLSNLDIGTVHSTHCQWSDVTNDDCMHPESFKSVTIPKRLKSADNPIIFTMSTVSNMILGIYQAQLYIR